MAMTSDASCDSSAASFYHEAAQGGDRHSNSSDDHDDDYDAPSSPFDLALARFLAGGFGGGDDEKEALAQRRGRRAARVGEEEGQGEQWAGLVSVDRKAPRGRVDPQTMELLPRSLARCRG